MRPFAVVILLLSAVAVRAADRVVVITDSHGVGDFGAGIENWLTTRADTAYDFFASGASAPRQWAQTRFKTTCGFHQGSTTTPRKTRRCYVEDTPHLDELWASQPPAAEGERRITVIAHGTNYPLIGRGSEVTVTKELIKQAFAASSVCVWIGPPNMTKTPGYDATDVAFKYGIIQEAIAAVVMDGGKRCELIDSRQLSTYPAKGGDGVHYHWLAADADEESRKQGSRWSMRVVSALDALLK